MLSGGKDSTALALYLRDRHPDRSFEYVFCDTHKELPETYEYLTRIEACLGQPIERLSSHHGERGFDHYLKIYGDFLPSPKQRWCTRRLKIEPFERHVGDDPTLSLCRPARRRATQRVHLDQGEHSGGLSFQGGRHRQGGGDAHPGRERGRALPSYYEWRSRSGCYFCFFQQKGEWVRLRERHPDLFDLAKRYEKVEQGYTWAQGESLTDLEKTERREEILRRERERRERLAARRRPRTLAQAFGFSELDDDGEDGCLICHL